MIAPVTLPRGLEAARHAGRVAMALELAMDPVRATRTAAAFGAPFYNENDVLRDLGPAAYAAWRDLNAARLAFLRITKGDSL